MELPEEVIDEMLYAQGEIILSNQKRKIVELDLKDSEQLLKSIKIHSKVRGRSAVDRTGLYNKALHGVDRYILVYPEGTRSEGKSITRTYKKRKNGRTQSVRRQTNNDVGFVNEFGAPNRNIKPTQWMRRANEEVWQESLDAGTKVYDKFLKAKGF